MPSTTPHATGRPHRPGQRLLPAVALLVAAALALVAPDAARPQPASAAVLAMPETADALLVQPAAGIAIEALARGLTLAGYEVEPGAEGADAVRVAVPAGVDAAALAAEIASSGLARGVEADVPVRAAIIPDDVGYERQAAYLDVIHAPAAWDLATGDGETVIAIVDSGIDYDHPEFVNRIAINTAELWGNGRDDDRNGCIDDFGGCNFVSPQSADPSCGYTFAAPNWRAWDDAGHGTMVAGIAAATGDNARGISGVAWDARLLPVKVLDCTGVGRISTAAAGIRYAADRGADVINVSLGTTDDSRVLREAVLYAQRAGALLVASAGNVPGEVTYPGAYPGVISVGASGAFSAGQIDYTRSTDFSGSGPGVDLLAPGLVIAGPVPSSLCGTPNWQCEDGAYSRVSGSSFAAALVTGAVALLRDEHPSYGAPLIRSQLLRSLQPSSDGGPGLLDLEAALTKPLFSTGAPGTARVGPGASNGLGN